MDNSVTVQVPARLDIENAISFIHQIYELPPAKEYIFDFILLSWVEPFALLYVSYHLANFLGDTPGITLKVARFNIYNAHLYAAHMGFFKSFGLDFGNNAGQAKGSAYYIPITIFNVDQIRSESHTEGVHIGDVLESKARDLAKMLTRRNDGDLVDTLEFSLREMFRNVVEHSGAKRIGICGQYWPTKHMVEIAILDNGIGIKESLKNNPFLLIETDKDALNCALLPGVSGKAYRGAKTNKGKGHWSNSGFGLFMTSELCRNGGSFFICSKSSGIMLRERSKRNVVTQLDGTALRLIIDTSSLRQVTESLSEFREKGYRIAKELNGAVIDPSAASLMLSRDFQ
ncbi:hypothetical protein GeomeDRAFT_2114 [Geobacter metallireducens RCH3]|uniref:Histidine kinase-like ATPase n=1 Tax=Geobacter metallireducens (strain ATCC 53774 / DSM 7210 / GS-15) TaxID=269799 RepID=Q39SL5_GEOMG|nr:HAMP domain-containing histidine kinase [Geobacter metallireducens]ABB32759.1 histidine kinase-like ATPase [Geobacter metallireducens GS-15]EHP86131.1 hypothetical protein GeomeDRAFT_2114 [Geobacter metallireducens RCH3]